MKKIKLQGLKTVEHPMKVNNITIIMIICIVTSGFHIKYRKKTKHSQRIWGEKKEQVPAIEAFPPSNEPYFWLYKHTQKTPTVFEHYSSSNFFFVESLYIIGNRSTNV